MNVGDAGRAGGILALGNKFHGPVELRHLQPVFPIRSDHERGAVGPERDGLLASRSGSQQGLVALELHVRRRKVGVFPRFGIEVVDAGFIRGKDGVVLESQGRRIKELEGVRAAGSRHGPRDPVLVGIKDFQVLVVITGRMLHRHGDAIVRSIVSRRDDGRFFQQGSELVAVNHPGHSDRDGVVAIGIVGDDLEDDGSFREVLYDGIEVLRDIPVQGRGTGAVVPGNRGTLDPGIFGLGPGNPGPVHSAGDCHIGDFSQIDHGAFLDKLLIDGILTLASREDKQGGQQAGKYDDNFFHNAVILNHSPSS